MMKCRFRHSIIWMVLIIAASVFWACEVDSNNYSVIPNVEFVNAEASFSVDILGNETKKVSLEFYLIDGDGDVGLWEGIGLPYVGDSSKNYFSDLYFIKDGELFEDTLVLDSAKNFIIPYLGNFGLDNTLKANVIIDYEYTVGNVVDFPYDSVMYSFYVMDRLFHVSNVDWSDTIVFN